MLSDDVPYRTRLLAAFADDGMAAQHSSLADFESSGVEGWHAPWRELDNVAAFVVDMTGEPMLGLDVLDTIRRRDCVVPVVILARRSGARHRVQAGANVVLEGDSDPARVVAVVASTLAARAGRSQLRCEGS